MGKMIDFLTGIAPVTVNNFLSDLTETKFISRNEFEAKSLGDRYILIKGYFGYERRYNPMMTIPEIQEHIKKLFNEYEDLRIKYPLGVPDLFVQLKYMSNQDKTKWLEEREQKLINQSLHHAICPRTDFNRPSLKDALETRLLSAIEVIAKNRQDSARIDEEFWNSTLNFAKIKEPCPF